MVAAIFKTAVEEVVGVFEIWGIYENVSSDTAVEELVGVLEIRGIYDNVE